MRTMLHRLRSQRCSLNNLPCRVSWYCPDVCPEEPETLLQIVQQGMAAQMLVQNAGTAQPDGVPRASVLPLPAGAHKLGLVTIQHTPQLLHAR